MGVPLEYRPGGPCGIGLPETETQIVGCDLCAFSYGIEAREHDETHGGLTENPYNSGTLAFQSWYSGYNTTNHPPKIHRGTAMCDDPTCLTCRAIEQE